MQCEDSSLPELTNVTIYGNDADDGGGIYCNTGSVPELENCIVWNNSNDSLNGVLTIIYSDIEYGFDGVGNIDLDPLFVNASGDNYNLTASSPCIDAGNPDSPLDPDNTTADMGALYYQGNSADNELPAVDIKLSNYPNPFNPSTTIFFNISRKNAENAEIIIYNLKGQKVNQLRITNYELGMNEAVWNGTDENNIPVTSGVYYYKLILGNDVVASKKMILLK
jgi:hypothetical protein